MGCYILRDDELLGQQQAMSEQQTSTPDSSWEVWSEKTTYEITRLRLIRWLYTYQRSSSADLFSQVLQLQREADEFAKQKDYVTAQLILDTALELTGTRSAPALAQADEDTVSTTGLLTPTLKSPRQWRREVIFGIDLLRQEFEFNSAELGFELSDAAQESLSVYSNGNPFIGLRINLNRSPESLMNHTVPGMIKSSDDESRRLNFAASAMIKASRDYHSGEFELTGRQSLGGKAYWRFGNRLDGTRYQRDLNFQYVQNTSSILTAIDVKKNFRLEVEDEFRWRHYREQSEIYPNYIQNQASFGAFFNSGYTTRLDARYSYIVRVHNRFPEDDYLEHRVDASISQNTASYTSILLENIWRNRVYTKSDPNTYRNTYQEEFARADLRLGLNETIALRMEGDFTLRQHKVPSSVTPDYLQTTANPQLQFNLFKDLQLSLGYLYLLQVNDEDIIQPLPSASTQNPYNPNYDDYYSHGVTLRFDLIRTDGFLFSLNEAYEIRTYPNVPQNNLPGLISETDSNINSLLLFLSWNFLSNWQMSVLANFDNDRSRTANQRNSHQTLFTVELGYSF
jgi:hypothetical protein